MVNDATLLGELDAHGATMIEIRRGWLLRRLTADLDRDAFQIGFTCIDHHQLATSVEPVKLILS